MLASNLSEYITAALLPHFLNQLCESFILNFGRLLLMVTH